MIILLVAIFVIAARERLWLLPKYLEAETENRYARPAIGYPMYATWTIGCTIVLSHLKSRRRPFADSVLQLVGLLFGRLLGGIFLGNTYDPSSLRIHEHFGNVPRAGF